MWQSFASAFYSSDLKVSYEPEGKDKQIEQIIQMIQNGQI
jgi:hypothetical protein